MLAKFSKEHTHTEDEVRFILQGRGVFHINPSRPAGVRDRGLGGRHDQRAAGHPALVRPLHRPPDPRDPLFQDTSGWTPHYLDDGVHAGYEPLCLGPAWMPPAGRTAT